MVTNIATIYHTRKDANTLNLTFAKTGIIVKSLKENFLEALRDLAVVL